MKKIYLITGSKGSGKSSSIAFFPQPTQEDMDKLCVVDTEDSMSDIIEQLDRLGLKFGAYIRMYERLSVENKDLLKSISNGQLPWVSQKQKGALTDYYEFFLNQMEVTLKDNKFKYLGIDTIEGIEAGLAAWAEVNRTKSGWSGQRDHGKLEVESVRPLYDSLLESFAQRGVEHIILTSHLRNVWHNNSPVPSKVEPGGRLALLSKLASVMLWLTPDGRNADGAPAAIVLKGRQSIVEIENGEWKIRRPLPQRIPHFTWQDFRRYAREGCDRENPAPGEEMTQDEYNMVSELLTDEQMKLMILGTEAAIAEYKAAQQSFSIMPSVPDVSEEERSNILTMLGNGMTPPTIARELGLPLPTVLRVKKADFTPPLDGE